MRPYLKTVPWLREADALIVAVNPVPDEIMRLPDPDRSIERLMTAADGSRTLPDLAAATGLSDARVATIVSELDDAGLLADAGALDGLTEAERLRWRNNLGFLEAFARIGHSHVEYHRKLRTSRVLVLGVGGIGSMMLMNLAGLGVGEIVAVDFDRVEVPNFTRQFTYEESQLGLSKLKQAQEWVTRFTSQTKISVVERRISSANDVHALLDGVDLVVSAIDQPPAVALWVNEACVRAMVPCLYGGFFFSKGRYESVWPGHSGCLGCMVVSDAEPEPVNRAIGPSVSIVTGLMAMEALRYLTGFAPPVSAAQTWIVDFADGSVTKSIRWGRLPSCLVCGGRAEDSPRPNGRMATGPLTSDSRVDVSHLTVVADGDEYLIGDLSKETFLAIPEVGAVALQALQRGATIGEAAAQAEAFAGTDVNVLEFADVLRDRGLIAGPGAPPPQPTGASDTDVRTGFLTAVARLLFSAPAWFVYALGAVSGLGILILEPALRPSWENLIFLPDPALSLLIDLATTIALSVVHELFHWCGARRFGLPARLRVSRRGLFLVLETDLSRLWAVPRRQRYAAFLAGMAFDGVLLGACLTAQLGYRHGWLTMPAAVDRYLTVVVITQVVTLIAQTALFMRTDLYAVMITALGCRNLYRVSMLIVRARLFGLTESQTEELNQASDQDRRVGRWFSGLYLVGVIGLCYVLFGIFVPSAFSLILWSTTNVLSTSPSVLVFWEALAVALFLTAEVLWPPAHWAVEHRRLRRTRRGTRRPPAQAGFGGNARRPSKAVWWALVTTLSLLLGGAVVWNTWPLISGTFAGSPAVFSNGCDDPSLPGHEVPILDSHHIAFGQLPEAKYNSVPPTSGPHFAVAPALGIYEDAMPEALQVHALEHGHVGVQYAADTPVEDIRALERIGKRFPRDVFVAPYPQIPHGIALTAWGRIEKLDTVDEGRIDRFIHSLSGRYDHRWRDDSGPGRGAPC